MYRQVLTREPGQADALHLLGVLAHQFGRNDAAVELIGKAIGQRADFPVAYYNLGMAYKALGRAAEAMAAWRKAIELHPGYAEAYNNLGVTLIELGRSDEAGEAFARALALKPDYAEAHMNVGNMLSAKGRLAEAIAAQRNAVRFKPDYAEAYTNLAQTLQEAGRLDEAIAAYQRALALRPDMVDGYTNLGNALYAAGRFGESEQVNRKLIALNRKLPGAYSNLANALKSQGKLEEAIAAYRQAISIDPSFPDAYNNLGVSWRDTGRPDEAVAAFRQALALKSDYAEAHNNLGNVLKDQGQLAEAVAAYRQALALNPEYVEAASNLIFALHYDPAMGAPAIAEELRRWRQRHAAPLRSSIQPWPNDRQPERRLRIGYVSPDFLNGSVGRFLLPLLAQHDRDGFEVFGYAQVSAPDEMTQQLRSQTDGWRSLVGLSDARAADLIREDRIDILVDLSMHTARNRLLVFARKPAPVQMTYLAYCSSTGLDTVDYRLTDPYLDPPGMDESVYTEQTVRLPETYWCYQQSVATPEVGPPPALRQGFVTFGCLNNFCKISAGALAVWAEILRAVPHSQLLLHAHEGSHRQELQGRLAREGIAAGRVRFAGKTSVEAYFELYQQIDIALDPFPYNGGTTTCDTLWMGVPVVSLAGQTGVGRAGLSILSNIGLPELVARSEVEYVRIAVALAEDIGRLGALRATLRGRMERSPLMDAPRFARGVEAAYRQMWRKWCAGGGAE